MLRKDSFLFRHRKKIIMISTCLIILVVGVGFWGGSVFRKRPTSVVNAIEREKVTVEKGNISSKITGSGTIRSSSTKSVQSEVAADVLDVKVSVGDKVKAGDILVELDKSDYETKIRELNKNISNLSNTVATYKEEIENLYVYADKAGYISNLSLDVGDSVNKNSNIFQLTNDEYYYVSCQVNYNSTLNIQIGDKAKVMLVDTLRYLDAEVTYVSALKELSDSGTPLQTVEIKIKNPGYTLDGLLASITITTSNISIKAVENVTIDADKSQGVKSKSSGTILELNVRNGDYVDVGDLVMVLENDDLEENLNDARSNLSDAYEDLENEKNNIDFYTIIAPIDGIVTSLNISVGDYVRSESELLAIVNNDNIEFDIEVDELDINDVLVGQEVNVTIDAIEDTVNSPIKGTVSNISIEGNSMNSVTSYPVTVSLSGSDEIKMGMNCSAEIVVESKEDVLVVPVEAITTKRNQYFVTKADGTEQEVEVGMYDEDNIEIVSGLVEGDEILLPAVIKATTSEETTNMQGGNSGMGGMSMPGGMMGGGSMGGFDRNTGGNFSGGRPNM